MLLLALLVQTLATLASPSPSILLHDAHLEDARALAIESAASRGWRILTTTTTSASFEQILEGDEEDGRLIAERTLRVFADFSEESAGARVTLRAEEIEWPGTEDEWRMEVTDRYSNNLMNALASLRAKWEAQWDDVKRGSTADTPQAIGHLIPEPSRSSVPPIGVWAYSAERHALSLGCEPGDRATRLEASGQDWEQHRVFCRDGSQRLVQCHYGECTSRH